MSDQLFATSEPRPPGVSDAAGYVVVAPERGVDTAGGGLTYAVPASLAPLRVGQRVVVPLGRGDQRTTGYVVDVLDKPGLDPRKIKPVKERDAGVALPDDLLELARWVARYYQAPLGMVFSAMLPAAVTRGIGLSRRIEVRAAPEVQASDDDAAKKPTKLQRALLDVVPDWTEIHEAMEKAGAKTRGPVNKLIEQGRLEQRTLEEVKTELETEARAVAPPPPPLTLNEGQAAAVQQINAALGERFDTFLLHGVTGSGKTEVYLRVIERAVERGLGAIVLVPEIALTPQTVGRFLARFPRVAVLHSGLTAAQRHAQWRRIRDGRALVVVGARSAVFAPLEKPGVIVVDEEHDTSYKQDQLPRYHARDVAIRRAQQHGACVVLGSATPSLESYRNAVTGGRGPGFEEGRGTRRFASLSGGVSGQNRIAPVPQSRPPETGSRFTYLPLPERAPGLTLPKVELVDLTEERRHRGGIHLLSRRLERELELCARGPEDRRGQALILLNRRGYANYIACPDHRCGWIMLCDHCDTTMVYHTRRPGATDPAEPGAPRPRSGLVRCHHCGAEKLLPELCPQCGKKLTLFGLGTQRVEEELARKMPGLRVARMDSDTMRTGKDYHDTLGAFGRGEVDVLLGTQMIAKGLDFSGVKLVGVVCADTSLHLPDFRAAERTFQLVAQVSGRAGRGSDPGRVILQSFNIEDPTIQLAAKSDFAGFAACELELREHRGLPPATRMARIVMRHLDAVKLTVRAREIGGSLQQLEGELHTGTRLRGPMVCPIARVADFHRQQIEVLAPTAASVQKLLTAARNRLGLVSDQHTAVDVDPVSLL